MASILCGYGRSESLEIMCDKNLISGLQKLHLPRFMVKPEVVSFLYLSVLSAPQMFSKKPQGHQRNGVRTH